MIGQYLSNTNEKATVLILQNILELNKALYYRVVQVTFFCTSIYTEDYYYSTTRQSINNNNNNNRKGNLWSYGSSDGAL